MIRIYFISLLFLSIEIFAQKNSRPNILWISCEDLSPHFNFYGDSTVRTPNIERLAREGVVYDNAFATAGVCAPSRCAIITGKNQVSVGGHNMRTLYSTFPEKTGLPRSYSIVPPVGVKAFPELLRAQGYYCTNNVKTDYQFEAPPATWDEISEDAHWRKRKEDQPFFAVFNITLTHESQVWQRSNKPLHADPEKIKVPPYYPDTRTVRKDMARFFSNIIDMDSVAGSILKQLEEDGLLENTIIFFWSDHGDGLPFAKRELYDRGLKIPLVIRFPDKYRAGNREKKLISTIDLAPTVLRLAGIPVPAYMEGKPITTSTNRYIYAARDRMDSEYDRVRAVRDIRYKYIRNFHPELPRYQNIEFRLQQDMMKEMLALKAQGKLNSTQLAWFAPTKPKEELYDLQNDPYEFKNLAADPAYRPHLLRLSTELDRWMIAVKDMGAIPEKELVKKMWQGKETPPATEPASVTIKNDLFTMHCSTPGASIAYKTFMAGHPDTAAWEVYTKPFTLKKAWHTLRVVTQRPGYEKTERIINWAELSSRFYPLRCEYLEDPTGIENKNPRLSWELISMTGNMAQNAYEILVASSEQTLDSNKADLWNTGKVSCGQSALVKYNGKPLASRQQCFWKVRVWDQWGNVSEWSRTGKWEMGLLDTKDWKAKWISRTKDNDSVRPAPLFRKEVTISKPVKKARIYISGLGYYELSINGSRLGKNELDPAVTRYDKRVTYVCHDITYYLEQGKNALGVMLGNGWYNYHTNAVWDFEKAPWRNAPVLIAQLEIEYSDGSKQTIITDESWTTSTGPVIFDGIMNGETYDARLEKPGWNTAGYNDASWQAATVVAGPAGKLCAQLIPPILCNETHPGKQYTEVKPGVWLVDFGKNMAGRVRLNLEGPAGTTVTIKYGEKLNADGTLDQRELARFIRSGDTQTDRYILKGKGREKWAPRFVYQGFRYVQITGYSGDPTGYVTAEALYTGLEHAGTFYSSSKLLNKLHEATRNTFLSNFHSYPTDCPHREKLGWTGDAGLIAETALFNFGMVQPYLKWLDDITDEQKPNGQIPGIIPSSGWGYSYGNDPSTRDRGYGPQWEGAYVTILWQLYLYTGDSGIIRKYYPGIKKYIDYLATHAKNYLIDFGIDDHKFFTTPTGPPIISSSFFHSLSQIMAKMAAISGKKDDAVKYKSMAEKIRQSYQSAFFNAATNTYGNGGQTSNSLALYHGLTNSKAVLKNLIDSLRNRNWHLDAGVLGVKAITNVLIDNRKSEELFAILSDTTYPSPGYWISKGATTLWQDWQGERSLNHIMFGSFADFFYKGLAGINPDPLKPGFKNIIFSPQIVKDLQWVSARHRSPYGFIESEWYRQDNKIIYYCSVPSNCTAILIKPNGATQQLSSGNFRFEFQE